MSKYIVVQVLNQYPAASSLIRFYRRNGGTAYISSSKLHASSHCKTQDALIERLALDIHDVPSLTRYVFPVPSSSILGYSWVPLVQVGVIGRLVVTRFLKGGMC